MNYTLKYVNEFGQSILFSADSGFILSSAEGLGANVIQTTNSQGINLIGGVLRGQSIQPRVMTFKGSIEKGNIEQKKKRLLDTILPGVRAKLIFNNIWGVDVVPTLTPDPSHEIRFSTFDFVLEAAYPFWTQATQIRTSLSGMLPRFKFYWNLTFPWKFGERISEQFINVNNAGSVQSGMNIIFHALAHVRNPSVSKISIDGNVTQETIKINRDMIPGESVTVENQANYVGAVSRISGIETDIFNNLDFDNIYFQLDPGDNMLRYDADSNRDSLDISIVFSITSAGVA